MEITPEIVVENLQNEAVFNAVVNHLTSSGRIVRTAEEDTNFLNNHVQTVVDGRVQTALNTKFGETMGAIDREIETLTGIPKANGEKTTVYAARAIAETKAKIAAEGADPLTVQQLRNLQEQLKTTENDYKQKLTAAEQKLFSQAVGYDVDGYMSTAQVFVPAHLKTEQEKQAYVQTQKTLIKNGFLSTFTPKTDKEGRTVYYKGEEPQLRTQDGQPKTASELIPENYGAYFIPQTAKATGTGEGSPESGTESGLKTRDDVHKYLAGKGFDAEKDRDAYFKAYQELTQKLNIK